MQKSVDLNSVAISPTTVSKKGSVHAVLLRGEPKTALVEYATNNQADLVIVGQRGLGWLKR
jgi:nucleotide-binding universal stress UspA family protein